MKIELKEHQINNLITFLDRVQIKGLNEIQAMNELLTLLQPKKEENSK